MTEWADGELGLVLEACERMTNHLTAAVVSNDPAFVQKVLANTVNGTTYVGIRARTTGESPGRGVPSGGGGGQEVSGGSGSRCCSVRCRPTGHAAAPLAVC